MKALCWHGTGDVRIDTLPDPKIIESRDAIVKISALRQIASSVDQTDLNQ